VTEYGEPESITNATCGVCHSRKPCMRIKLPVRFAVDVHPYR
jgi:hypothetical protein